MRQSAAEGLTTSHDESRLYQLVYNNIVNKDSQQMHGGFKALGIVTLDIS